MLKEGPESSSVLSINGREPGPLGRRAVMPGPYVLRDSCRRTLIGTFPLSCADGYLLTIVFP